MFVLRGAPLNPDVAFIDAHGIQRPANWLRLASTEQRLDAGITEEPDQPIFDPRFYWGFDQGGKLLPRDHDQLVVEWVERTKRVSNALLAPTDWLVIREMDNGTPCPAGIKAWREAVRTGAQSRRDALAATASTAALEAYITGDEYNSWPECPRQ